MPTRITIWRRSRSTPFTQAGKSSRPISAAVWRGVLLAVYPHLAEARGRIPDKPILGNLAQPPCSDKTHSTGAHRSKHPGSRNDPPRPHQHPYMAPHGLHRNIHRKGIMRNPS